jgi:hypothetical protein
MGLPECHQTSLHAFVTQLHTDFTLRTHMCCGCLTNQFWFVLCFDDRRGTHMYRQNNRMQRRGQLHQSQASQQLGFLINSILHGVTASACHGFLKASGLKHHPS